jgi:alginate O-acetyltransferase complex protein AlgI
MLFTSWVFFVLLLPTLILYWAVSNQTARLWLLLTASLTFYGFYHWPSVFLLLFTITFNYFCGRTQGRLHSKQLLIFAACVNFSILGWFKYAGFVAYNINGLLHFIGVALAVPPPPVFLPLGISFFTFQVIAYQVDVYRGEIKAEDVFVRFAVFKSFFPQLIAGPIVRGKDFLPQLHYRIKFNAALFQQGLWLVMAGLALKFGVADVLGQFANEAFSHPEKLSTVGAWTNLYAYAFQIFSDFWGYSTIAVGLGALFGVVLPLNFDSPYFSSSLREFWHRWHITLSIWFRDYVYIPLGGNRKRRNLNLVATMTLAGLWHGAGWPFVLWGFCHGTWLTVERHFASTSKNQSGTARFIKTVLVFHGVCLLWVLFRAPTMSVAVTYFSRLLLPPFTSSGVPSILKNWLVVFALVQWPISWTFKDIRFTTLSLKAQLIFAMACCYLILAYAGASVDFIYFTF